MCFSAATLQRRSNNSLVLIYCTHAAQSVQSSIYNDMHGLRPPLSSVLDTECRPHQTPRRVNIAVPMAFGSDGCYAFPLA